MPEIIPAILALDTSDLKNKISQLPAAVSFVHIDVLEEDIWAHLDIDFEAHLMVKNPTRIVGQWAQRGAKRIIVHQFEGRDAALQGIEIGLGVELKVPIEQIFEFIPAIDFVHLMSIDALGTQGDDFEPAIFDRIKQVKKKFPQVPISVDGGINTTNYQALGAAGADRLVVGSGFKDLWKSLTRN